MAYAMTKQGSLDNCITYEFICDTVADMNAIENRYRTIGTVAIVLSGESEGLEVYIAGSNKQWNNIGTMGASGDTGTGGLSIYICAQNEVSNGVPNIQDPDETTVYLVAAGETSGNLYEEYIYVNNAWEKFGAANIDLSGYAPIANPIFTGNISLGRNTNYANGTGSFACGYDVVASGNYAHAEGSATRATGNNSHAEGAETEADGPQSHAEGVSTRSSAQSSHAEGVQTTASFVGAHAEGNGTTASQAAAHAEGMETTALGVASHAEGLQSTASGQAAHAEGMGGTYTLNGTKYESKAEGTADHTEGYQCLTANSMPGNHAEGYMTRATGGGAHSEGNMTVASGQNSHAEGNNTVAQGVQSHAEGSDTKAIGTYSHAEGQGGTYTDNGTSYESKAAGTADHTEGYLCLTESLGAPGKHAEGNQTRATGGSAHSEGTSTLASGFSSHAEGQTTVASGDYSHAEGNNSLASGYCAHVQGQYTIASGSCSHAEGCNITAAGRNSHVFGRYNVVDTDQTFEEWEPNKSYFLYDKVKRTANNTVKRYICKIMNADASFIESNWYDITGEKKYIEIVGNGITGNTSNARALDWDGNERLKGDLYVGCNSDSTGGVKIARIPDPPTTDGTYTLQATVASGIVTYTWVAGV